MINVYAANATDFSTNGIATLEPTLCELAMTINGAWVLTLEHPFDENNKYINLDNAEPIRPELKKGNIIKVTDIAALRDCDSTQLFRIYDTVKTLTSIRVTAFPVGMEATYDSIIEELKLNNKNGKQVISELSAAADEVTSGSDIGKYTLSIESSFPTSKKRSVNYKNTNLIAALCGSDEGSFVNKFNAEVAYNNYEIKVKKRLGSGTDYDVRLGKNLTGLSFEIDDSAVVTRLYPISQDDLRLKDDTDRRYIPGYEIRYIDSENESYPYVRAAFVEVPYSLIDTDIEAQVPTATAVLTETVYNAVYDEIYRLMYEFWTDILEDNEFSYTGTLSFDISLIPEFVQATIKDISEAVANNVLGTSLDNVYVAHPGLRSWFTNAIRAGMDWISEIDLPEKGWIENQDGSYSYGTDLRNLKNEWAYIDRKMSYFNNNEKWEKEKDDSYEWDWVQKKGQRKKFGNNKRYLARNTYVYDYDGGCKYYWFDEEGWWDGTSESSGWAWHQDSTGWWFGDADPDGDDSKYIHDDWAFIRETADSPRKLYYFNSDGYLDGEEVVDWNWHKVNGKWYFGSTDHEKRATYLVSQWMQIEGDWRLFDSNGYVEDLEATKAALISALSIYLQEESGSLIATEQNALFDLLYSNMEEYCKDLYDNGLDKPSINVSVDFVDLSKTQEYAAFSNLEKICLGDDVEVHDPVHGIDAITERVMGLTYDCIRGYNTKIEVGGVSSVTSLFDTSVKGTGNEQRLVAGENVTINGNVINVSANTGDVYAGDKVSVTQLQTTGQPIAKIYVNGTPTTIYAVGSDVEVEPIKQSGDHIATITVGGIDYNIYADTGLKYWVETETDIYREGVTNDLVVSDDRYLIEGSKEILRQIARTFPLRKYIEYKINDAQCLGAVFIYYDRDTHTKKYATRFCLVSPTSPVDYHEGVDWNYRADVTESWSDVENAPIYTPIENDDENRTSTTPMPPWPRAKYTYTFSYKNASWKAVFGTIVEEPQTHPDGQCYAGILPDLEITYEEHLYLDNVDLAKKLIDAAGASTESPDAVGVSHNDHIFYYCPRFDNTNHDESKDLVYITKDGYINAKGYKIDGAVVGSFYKTTLYRGTQYASSITLSESYTKFDLLMIETYNQDDKKNLASTVNVSDLVGGSYIGVDGYLMYTITNAKTLTFHEAPSDSNHSRYIKAVYGLRTSHEGGTESPITDVTVDGVSVVSGGVAVIDGKQDAFGDVNVVNPTDGQVLTYDATNDEWKNANGGGGASAINDLTDVNITNPANGQVLKYNSTSQKWENGNGGGGSTVSITPILSSGTKIAEFEIDGVSGDLFAPNGGGGGSEYDEEILYSGVDSQSSYTLSNNISDYDLIGIRCARSSNFEVYNIFPVSYLIDSITTQKKIGLATDDKYTFFKVTNETTLTRQDENDLHIVGVIGIVTGGSGGGTTVIANPSGTATDILTKIQVDNTIYEVQGGGGGEVVTDILNNENNFEFMDSGEQVVSYVSSQSINFSTNSQYDEQTSKGEAVYKIAIPKEVKKIRYEIYEMGWYATSTTDDFKFCVGVKSTLDTTNFATPSDNDFIAKNLHTFSESGYELEGELEVNSASDYYLYLIGNGWHCTVTKLQLVSNASGGGGNTITYGTDVPTSSANDGDLYFLLNGGMKKAEFLYMNNAWSLIDGVLDVIEDIVLTQSRRNSGAADTYTATEECTVLCINQNMNGEASTKSLTSSIVTTGTILYTDEYSSGWSNPERNQCTRISVIHLEQGETVTLSNSYEGNYTTQLHVVVKISSYTTINQLTMKLNTARADNSYGTSQTYSLATAGLYFAIGFQTRGTGGGTTYATISASNEAEIYELIRAGANESISIAMVKHPNMLTFAWNNQSDYATKGYAVYKIS